MATPAVDPIAPGGWHAPGIVHPLRLMLYVVGGAIATLVALGLGMTAASAAGPAGAAPGTGFTLCASTTGAVTYASSGTCAAGTTPLVVGQESQVATLNSEVATLKGEVSTLQAQVATLNKTLTGVTRTTVHGQQALRISGENVQLVNGTGSEQSADGLGNLIIGYDENPGTQTGSHNLVLGSRQSFTSFGGLLAGFGNTLSGSFASVSGGQYNVAADSWSSVSGGCDNIAGQGTVPTGPCSNQAESVSGGASNDAAGVLASISGGQGNHAAGAIASVSGGLGNYANGIESTVSGGYANSSDNNETAILGGGENTATGDVSSIAGGYYNTATQDEATVLGGCSNLAGAGNLSINPACYNFGNSFMGVVGGIGNQAITLGSTVGGGTGNVVSGGQTDSIAGGHNETLALASLYMSSIGSSVFTP